MNEQTERLQGEGDVICITQKRVRKSCELCEKPANYKHTFLLENFRSNPASSAYGQDDCSYCEDAAVFTCWTCKPDVPIGHGHASRYECSPRFSHLFLEWQEVERKWQEVVTNNP